MSLAHDLLFGVSNFIAQDDDDEDSDGESVLPTDQARSCLPGDGAQVCIERLSTLTAKGEFNSTSQ